MHGSIETAFISRVGTEPEMKTSAAGKPWLRFSAAVGKDEPGGSAEAVALQREQKQQRQAMAAKLRDDAAELRRRAEVIGGPL